MAVASLSETIQTPLLEVEGVLVKLECANRGGSVKDRIARHILGRALASGELRPGDTVVEATSGNTGIALALAARRLDLRAIVFMPEHMSPERRRIMERLGAVVRLTPRAESFAGACARRDTYRGRSGFFIPDQFANPENSECHRTTTGRELVTQVRARGGMPLGAFVAGVGTGGTLMGVSAALREAFPGVRRVAVEPDESAVMSGGPAGEHGIAGIGDGFVPALVDLRQVDEVMRIPTAEAHATARRLHREHGYCVGPSAGANFAAALRLRDRGLRTATLWPDCADRYGSQGFAPPADAGTTCPLRSYCRERTHMLFGDGVA